MLPTVDIFGKLFPVGTMELKSVIDLKNVKTDGHIFRVTMRIECKSPYGSQPLTNYKREFFIALNDEELKGVGFIDAYVLAANKAVDKSGLKDIYEKENMVVPVNFYDNVKAIIAASIRRKSPRAAYI